MSAQENKQIEVDRIALLRTETMVGETIPQARDILHHVLLQEVAAGVFEFSKIDIPGLFERFGYLATYAGNVFYAAYGACLAEAEQPAAKRGGIALPYAARAGWQETKDSMAHLKDLYRGDHTALAGALYAYIKINWPDTLATLPKTHLLDALGLPEEPKNAQDLTTSSEIDAMQRVNFFTMMGNLHTASNIGQGSSLPAESEVQNYSRLIDHAAMGWLTRSAVDITSKTLPHVLIDRDIGSILSLTYVGCLMGAAWLDKTPTGRVDRVDIGAAAAVMIDKTAPLLRELLNKDDRKKLAHTFFERAKKVADIRDTAAADELERFVARAVGLDEEQNTPAPSAPKGRGPRRRRGGPLPS